MEPFHKTLDVPLRVGMRPYQGELGYSTADPHSASLIVRAGKQVAVWEFDRQLLRDGLTRAVGGGDVQIQPGTHPSRVLISLTSPGHNSMTFSAARELVQIFVTRIYTAVPEGTEHEWIDFDREIAALLEEA